MRPLPRWSSTVIAIAAPLVSGVLAPPLAAQELVPKLPDLTGIVKNPDWAVVLGKALFWDIAVGSDGMACASCHFHAGADARISNALSPGLIELPDRRQHVRRDRGRIAVRARRDRLRRAWWTRPTRWSRTTSRSTSWPTSSTATRRSTSPPTTWSRRPARSTPPSAASGLIGPFDRCDEAMGDVFHAGAFAARQVEPRNTPTDDQRRVQSPQLLGRAGDERLQRRRRVRPGGRAEQPGRAPGRAATAAACS